MDNLVITMYIFYITTQLTLLSTCNLFSSQEFPDVPYIEAEKKEMIEFLYILLLVVYQVL